MIFTIVIVLIVVLVLMAIGANAVQQHKERQQAEKRAELAKQKAIIDETEDVCRFCAGTFTQPGDHSVLV